ncbi:MAG: hypothetical protein ACOZQL_21700 [Myxococcota bacterium]
MRLVFAAATLALALAGCALRPRYADFVTPKTEGKELTFVLLDPAANQPIANAKIEVSELKNRIIVTTAADGTFKLPVEKRYLDENPVLVVTLPKGVSEYRVAIAPPPAPPAPAPVVPAEPAPAVEADAGVPANG